MKKFIYVITIVAMHLPILAQIPQNGLFQHWRLDSNLNSALSAPTAVNLINNRPFACNTDFMGGSLYLEIECPSCFTPSNDTRRGTAYQIKEIWFGRRLFCWDGPRNIEGFHRTTLNSTQNLSFDTSARTVSLWVKRYDSTTINTPFYIGGTGNFEAFALQLHNNLAYFVNRGQGITLPIGTDTNWHHYSCVYDGDSFYLYIDGSLRASALGNLTNTASSIFSIGADASTCDIDEVVIHRRALNAAEVNSIYRNCPALNPVATRAGDELRANLVQGSTYQWINCGTQTSISGATQRIFTPTESGRYAVVITNGTCSDTSVCVDFFATSLNEHLKYSFNMYPNPAQSAVKIFLEHTGDAQITMYDIFGKQVLNTTTHIQETTLSIEGLANGIYFISVESNGYKLQKRLTIQK